MQRRASGKNALRESRGNEALKESRGVTAITALVAQLQRLEKEPGDEACHVH